MACVKLGVVLAKIKAALQCNRVREEFHNENIDLAESDLVESDLAEFDLAEFEGTLSNLKALIDANPLHSNYAYYGEKGFIGRVRAAVFEADRLLDEVNNNSAPRSSSFSKSITQQFDNIQTKLDALMIESCLPGLPLDLDICFWEKNEDEKDIVGMLLSGEANACFVSIVGMAGMGKTYLARNVFYSVKSKFKLCLWVSVADNSQDLSLRSVFEKILRDGLQYSVDVSGYTTDWLMKKIEEKIGGKRYLLVLDDVWCESSTLWFDFRQFVNKHNSGSRVLITSRSKIVASVIRSRYTHELERLSQMDSMRMFTTLAEASTPDDLAFNFFSDHELFEKSSGIPLIIEAIVQVERKWFCISTIDFANDIEFKKVMSTFRLSYDQLDSTLKQCFGFCSIFPKNHVIQKQVLISLWLAQGYLVPTHEGQTMEEVGEDYCSTLLSRSFFTDIKRNAYDKVISFEMPHIIHDLAILVVETESLILPIKGIVGRDYYKQGNTGDIGECRTLFNDGGDFFLKMGLLSANNIVEDAELLASTTEYSDSDGSLEQGNAGSITMEAYQGMKLPNRVHKKSNSFPGIVKLTLTHIRGLQHLTPLRQLSYLNELCLRRMWDVECIESHEFALQSRFSKREESRFSKQEESFPSLQKLVLEWMPKLKGWSSDIIWNNKKAEDFYGNHPRMEKRFCRILLRLRDLSIQLCPNMTSFPPCPLVKQLELRGINEALKFCIKQGYSKRLEPLSTERYYQLIPTGLEKLIVSYDARVFIPVFREFKVAYIVDISINYCYGEQDLKITMEVFQSCASSLRNLSIDGLYNLKSLSDVGIQHLTKLQSLSIKECSKLDLEEVQVEMEEGMPWKSLNSLSSLTLDRIPKIVNLPEGLQHLASLQSLHIKRCKNLTVIGECLRDLTSFQALRIEDCKNLKTIPEYLKSQTTQL